MNHYGALVYRVSPSGTHLSDIHARHAVLDSGWTGSVDRPLHRHFLP